MLSVQPLVVLSYRHSQAELRAFFELPPPPVAHRAAADVAVLAEIVKALANMAGVGMQGLMALDCKRKHMGTFQAYEGKVYTTLMPRLYMLTSELPCIPF